MTYQDALAYFTSLEPRGWRLGLDRMAAFCRAAGLEDSLGGRSHGPRYLHVAGTNGKGTTTAYLQSLLVEHGHRTGAFFSPYVVDPRERWQFGREMIASGELAQLTEELIPVAESFSESEYGGITEFEFKTGIDFAYTRLRNCEWVALEVGLGGRYDATNVVVPTACAIVSIGLDHVNILGDTRAAIAREKAGIIKPGIPVVVGSVDAEAAEVIDSVADENRSPVWRWGVEYGWRDGEGPRGSIRTPSALYDDVQPGIAGAMQGHNLAVAVATLEAAGMKLDEEAVRRGAERATAPGRFQVMARSGIEFILDGAHNPQAAEVLARSFANLRPGKKAILVTNMVRGHDPADFYQEILPIVDRVHLPPLEFHRAFGVDEIGEALRRLGIQATPHPSMHEALHAAASDAEPEQPVLVTGSFYLVGDAIRELRAI